MTLTAPGPTSRYVPRPRNTPPMRVNPDNFHEFQTQQGGTWGDSFSALSMDRPALSWSAAADGTFITDTSWHTAPGGSYLFDVEADRWYLVSCRMELMATSVGKGNYISAKFGWGDTAGGIQHAVREDFNDDETEVIFVATQLWHTPPGVNPGQAMLHPMFGQAVAHTGKLYCENVAVEVLGLK